MDEAATGIRGAATIGEADGREGGRPGMPGGRGGGRGKDGLVLSLRFFLDLEGGPGSTVLKSGAGAKGECELITVLSLSYLEDPTGVAV